MVFSLTLASIIIYMMHAPFRSVVLVVASSLAEAFGQLCGQPRPYAYPLGRVDPRGCHYTLVLKELRISFRGRFLI